MAGRFFSNAQNKELFVKGHGVKFENEELTEFLHMNWGKYEFTASQWAKMREDTQARESMEKIAPNLLNKLKLSDEKAGAPASYDILTPHGFGANHLRDSIMEFAKSDKYKDKDGKYKDIYEMYDKDEKGKYTSLAKAAKIAFDDQIHQGRISAPRLENMFVNMVDEDG